MAGYQSITALPVTNIHQLLHHLHAVPNLALTKKMQFGTVWTSIYLIIAFNLGDLLGKLTGDFRNNFNSESIIYLVAARFFFYFTFPLLVK